MINIVFVMHDVTSFILYIVYYCYDILYVHC